MIPPPKHILNSLSFNQDENRENPTNAHPATQAGHQTHQTTTCVHTPQTSHPKAACVKTVSTSALKYQHAASRTTGGESTFNSARASVLRTYLRGREVVCGLMRWMKLSGAQRRPTMKEREKLRVARVERKRPRMRREKDLMRWYCCGWGVRV